MGKIARYFEIGRNVAIVALVVSAVLGWWYNVTPKEPRVTLEYSVKVETVILDASASPKAKQPSSKQQSPPADPPKTEPKKSGGSFGSGTLIGYIHYHFDGNDGVFQTAILTNEHVIKGASKVYVHWKGKKIEGRVIAVDSELDLALVQVPVRLPTVELLAGPIWDGENTWVVGYPFGLSASITHGFISPKAPKEELRQESASIWFGNSGGGVFVLRDGRYVLAGVTDAIFVKPVMGGILFANTVGFFVPIESVKIFLAKNHVTN